MPGGAHLRISVFLRIGTARTRGAVEFEIWAQFHELMLIVMD